MYIEAELQASMPAEMGAVIGGGCGRLSGVLARVWVAEWASICDDTRCVLYTDMRYGLAGAMLSPTSQQHRSVLQQQMLTITSEQHRRTNACAIQTLYKMNKWGD